MLTQAIVAHLIADWVFQNHWIANHKSSLLHPAAWVHGMIHLIVLLVIFPVHTAIAIAALHMLIDTRKPANWWINFYKQTSEGPYAIHVAIWLDQVFHISVLAFFVAVR